MSRQVILRSIFGLILIAAFTAIPTFAQQPPPMPPHVFFGAATVNGQPVAVNSQVEARGAGIKTTRDNAAIQDNPLTVTEAGRYGGPRSRDHQLTVQGEIAEGTPIEFYIDGVKAQCAVPGGPWQASYPYQPGMFTELNLKVGEASVPSTSSTATATATRKPSATDSGQSVQATATRQTPQAPSGAGTQQPPASAATAASSPVAEGAQAASATAQGQVVVATPTNLAPQSVDTTPSVTPALETAAAPSATPAPASPTEPSPPTPTRAVVAQAPKATSNPIIGPETVAPAEQSPTPSAGDSGGATPGRTLALWGGVAALAIAAVAGVVFLVRARSR